MDEGNPVEDRGNRAGKVPEIGGIAEDDGGEDDIQKAERQERGQDPVSGGKSVDKEDQEPHDGEEPKVPAVGGKGKPDQRTRSPEEDEDGDGDHQRRTAGGDTDGNQ